MSIGEGNVSGKPINQEQNSPANNLFQEIQIEFESTSTCIPKVAQI